MTNKSLALHLRLLADLLEAEETTPIKDAKIVYEKGELLFSRSIKLERPVEYIVLDVSTPIYETEDSPLVAEELDVKFESLRGLFEKDPLFSVGDDIDFPPDGRDWEV